MKLNWLESWSVEGDTPVGVCLSLVFRFLRLARRHVLVQELPAVEVLARVDTLCLDKTGTITTGRIRLERVEGPGGAGAGPELYGALAALTSQESNATALAVREGLEALGEADGSVQMQRTRNLSEPCWRYLQ